MKNEIRLLLKSIWVWAAVLLLPMVACSVVTKSAASFFESELFASEMPKYLDQTCSQIVFPGLYLCSVFSVFYFQLKGVLQTNIDRNRGVLQLNLVFNTPRKICFRRIVSAVVQSILISLCSIAVGMVYQLVVNKLWPQYERPLLLHSGAIFEYMQFVLSIIVLDVTLYVVGMIIGILIRNRILGIAASMAFLLLVVPKTFLMRGTYCLYSKAAVYFGTNPNIPITDVPETLMRVLEVTTCLCSCVIAGVLLSEKKIGYEG